MAIATLAFQSILEDAKSGALQLPEFQRDYVWNRRQVVDLFDSVRQKYPIGAFLFMERNPEVEITARPLEGTVATIVQTEPNAFVLDGQQRITSGLALYHGVGPSNYYLHLDRLWELAKDVDLRDGPAVRKFLGELDPDDGYCVGRVSRSNPLALLSRHLLFTGVLPDKFELKAAIDTYTEFYPERTDFCEAIIRDNFGLAADVVVPVTTVERNRPVEAVSRIFATLNTTGKPLTDFELVVALLYPAGIRLRSDIEENRDLAVHYNNMDRTGEVFLQTIAMLAGESPKKSRLAKTVTATRYRQHRNEAVDLLENVGQFLTARLGAGLDQSGSLVPYDSIFAPMALVWRHIHAQKLSGAVLATAENKLQKWFVASALANRYQEGVHNKQTRDKDEMIAWIDGAAEPSWLADFRVPRLRSDSPDGAVGRLMRCLINRRKPVDPVSQKDVGVRPSAVVTAKHHIFPTRFCEKYIPGWVKKSDNSDLALNVTMVSQETNGKWFDADPANQLREVENLHSARSVETMLSNHLIDTECARIMSLPNKTRETLADFLEARERAFLKELEHWDLQPAESDLEPDEA